MNHGEEEVEGKGEILGNDSGVFLLVGGEIASCSIS